MPDLFQFDYGWKPNCVRDEGLVPQHVFHTYHQRMIDHRYTHKEDAVRMANWLIEFDYIPLLMRASCHMFLSRGGPSCAGGIRDVGHAREAYSILQKVIYHEWKDKPKDEKWNAALHTLYKMRRAIQSRDVQLKEQAERRPRWRYLESKEEVAATLYGGMEFSNPFLDPVDCTTKTPALPPYTPPIEQHPAFAPRFDANLSGTTLCDTSSDCSSCYSSDWEAITPSRQNTPPPSRHDSCIRQSPPPIPSRSPLRPSPLNISKRSPPPVPSRSSSKASLRVAPWNIPKRSSSLAASTSPSKEKKQIEGEVPTLDGMIAELEAQQRAWARKTAST